MPRRLDPQVFDAIVSYLEQQFEEIIAELQAPAAKQTDIHGHPIGDGKVAVNIAPRVIDTLLWISERYGKAGVELGAQFMAYACTPREDDSPKPARLLFADASTGEVLDPSTVDPHTALAAQYVTAMAARDEAAVTAIWATISAGPHNAVIALYSTLFATVLNGPAQISGSE